ncbi:MAG: endo alpha-1,4 polygalactosaminidase [Monoraphidium minutum]|nr:MAG: endo alpha-1,4 polygalactosaminidase [Monoraphidium minutum]
MPPLKERALRPSQQPAPAAPAAPVTRAAAAAAPKAKWQRPPPMAAFQYQLGEIFDPSKHLLPNVTLYVVDLVETSPAAVAAIKAAGGYPVCYFSVGYEDWRPDKADFPNASLANAMGDWPGEKWVDFRHPGVLPVMRKRLALCSDKGFLGAEADNTDILALPTGIKGLTSADQLKFLRDLADAAHDNGLAFGLKNTLLQVPAMVGKADFAVNEACSQFKECRLYKAFEDAGVAIFNIEYQRAAFDRICPLAKAAGVVSIFKENDLKALPRTPCPGKA